MKIPSWKKAVSKLKNNEIILLKTETVIGIFSLTKKELGKKINKIKRRNENQELQVMVANFKQLNKLINNNKELNKLLKDNFPGNKSFLLNSNHYSSKFLLGNNKTILIRMPSKKSCPLLFKIIKKTGPLFSTSANIHSQKTFEQIEEASYSLSIDYFEEDINQHGQSLIYNALDYNNISEIKRKK